MTLDTNILIAHLQGDREVLRALSFWKLSGKVLLVSTIARAELLSRSDLTEIELAEIRKFLENFSSIPFDNELAEYAASLRRRFRLTLPDAGIAATALSNGVPLVTRNIRDFRKIPNLAIVTI